jgi:hypothetical protein
MNNLKKSLLLLFLFSCVIVSAQPGNPSDGPIYGIIYLILAGIGVGIFGLRKKRKQQ